MPRTLSIKNVQQNQDGTIDKTTSVEYDTWKIYKVLSPGTRIPNFFTVAKINNKSRMVNVTQLLQPAPVDTLQMHESVRDGYPV